MLKIRSLARILAGQAAVICCLALPWDDPFEQYFQRKDTVTLDAGNAKAVNSVTHIIDPWPRYVGNTRIPGNGERMVGAVERYRDVSKLPRAPKPIAPELGASTNFQTTTGGQPQ
jgi:hypothetical protein